MGWRIKLLEKGKRPTLLETEKANEIIEALNALGNINIKLSDKTAISYYPGGVLIQIGVVPQGFFEKEIQICEDDEVKTYTMLVKGPID